MISDVNFDFDNKIFLKKKKGKNSCQLSQRIVLIKSMEIILVNFTDQIETNSDNI